MARSDVEAGRKRAAALPVSVPILPASCSRAEFVRAYRRAQCVVLRSVAPTSAAQTSAVLQALRAAHESDPQLLGATYTLENSGSAGQAGGLADPSRVLADAPQDGRWYASFILQGAPKDVSSRVAAALPCAVPRALAAEPEAGSSEQPTWFFIGANAGPDPLAGRPEHTDELSHDGTWHFQLSGSKVWTVRPTDELLEARAAGAGRPPVGSPAQEIVCSAGDVLLINTRLWWHSTRLPPGGGRTRARGASRQLSISYARDFVLGGSEAARARAGPGASPAAEGMANVDGLFATCLIRKGTAILSAADMPDCELPTSSEPNCEVCEDAVTGELVLVAARDIASGEFFTVPADSSDEDESGGDGAESESGDEDDGWLQCQPCPSPA